MTKDRDFKRIVRQRAQESGEPYTEALAKMRATDGDDQARWVVVRTIVGTEDRVRDWLKSEYEEGLERLLLPRFDGRNVAPGVLLIEPAPTFDVGVLATDPWIRDYVGAPDPPRRQRWSEVLEFLKGEARQPRGRPGRGQRFAPAGWPDWSPSAFYVPLTAPELSALFDLVALGRRAELSLDTGIDVETRQQLMTEVARAAVARRKIVHAHRAFVDEMVGQFVARTDLPFAELRTAGLAGLESAIARFDRRRGVEFVTDARWWVRSAVVRRIDGVVGPQLTVHRLPADGEVARRLMQRYHEELNARFPAGFDVEATGLSGVEDITPPNGAFLVVELGVDPVGCGAVRRLADGVAEVKRMWIDPEARGRGIGSALLVALEREARNLRCTVVRLDTNEHLQEAIRLYRARGYLEIQAYNDNPYATHWFEKRLR